ncbi:unnamed protein product [Diamesa hyperborea]
MKFTFKLCCLVVLSSVCQGTQAELNFTYVGCNSSTIGTCIGMNCNVDKAGALSFGCSLTRDLPKLSLFLTTFTKVGYEFRQSAKTPKLDWCTAMKDTPNSRYMKNLVNFLKERAPSFTQQCPIKGRLEIKNLSMDLEYFTFLPNGEYKNIIRVFKTPIIDWCSAMKGVSISRYMKNYADYLKEYAPSFMQKCPYKGRLEIKNLSLDNKYFKFLPNGEYKNIIHVSDEIDENIFTLNYNTVLNSN